MKKLVDVARDLHVTPQAIYKRKGTDALLSARITGGTIKKGKHTFLNDDAVSAIMEAFSAEFDTVDPEPEPETEQVSIIKVLQEQLAEKDRQISTLQMLLSQQQQLTMKTQLYLEAPKRFEIKKLWDIFRKD